MTPVEAAVLDREVEAAEPLPLTVAAPVVTTGLLMRGEDGRYYQVWIDRDGVVHAVRVE